MLKTLKIVIALIILNSFPAHAAVQVIGKTHTYTIFEEEELVCEDILFGETISDFANKRNLNVLPNSAHVSSNPTFGVIYTFLFFTGDMAGDHVIYLYGFIANRMTITSQQICLFAAGTKKSY